MSFRIESSGGTGANRVTIEPVESKDSERPHACITVKPTNSEHPTMPILPRGSIYRDRDGFEFTILNVRVVEFGPDDGESSFWKYEYLALTGAHSLTGLHS